MKSKLSLFVAQTQALIQKEFTLEFRNKHSSSSLLLYLAGTIIIVYFSFRLKAGQMNGITWNALFWIITLFTAVTASTKSFAQEVKGRHWYYYAFIKPEAFVMAKIIFNTVLITGSTYLSWALFALLIGNPIQDNGQFFIAITLGSVGFASVLTLVSAIAAIAGNSATLLPVLSFPILLPQLLMSIRFSKNALDGLEWSNVNDEIINQLAMIGIAITLSILLYPQLWKSQSQ